METNEQSLTNKKQKKESETKAKPPSLRVKLRNLTVPELRSILRFNDQSTFGNKSDLILRILYMVKHGSYPRCPKCRGGRIKPRRYRRKNELKYYCPGFPCPGFGPTAYHDCDYETDENNAKLFLFPTNFNLTVD